MFSHLQRRKYLQKGLFLVMTSNSQMTRHQILNQILFANSRTTGLPSDENQVELKKCMGLSCIFILSEISTDFDCQNNTSKAHVHTMIFV